MDEPKNTVIRQDSFTIGTAATTGALKVYFDLNDLEGTQKKLENFFKTKIFVDELKARL